MYKRISYILNPQDPGWPGNPKVENKPYSQISIGNACNEHTVNLFNHFGSHMDAPKHAYEEGLSLWEMPVESFIYKRPVLLDIEKSYGELVTELELAAHEDRLKNADLLMIRSGFSHKRAADPQGYSARGPGVSANACKYIAEQLPAIKGIALDWLSLSSYMHQEEGLQAHRYLLNPQRQQQMVILEDLDFTGLEADKLLKVIALPLLVIDVDSGPCHVVAEYSL